ncbi:MAG TPA: glycosyltransferase family 4 protein [Leptolyngbyaceae cyanobacterium M65_K2018_010]|nr:glycosyltransferase family 4 protein [Leptolyngbyaceae cyanobacterium M65_K2018_010]
MTQAIRQFYFLSTPVGPLGSGLGGGVELTVLNLAEEFLRRGHRVKVVAPEGSQLREVPVIEIAGQLQPTAHTQARDTPIILPVDGVLGQMWEFAYQNQLEVDLIVNFAFDWLPFYLTPFFQIPVAHFVTMGSLSDALDQAVEQIAQQLPGRLGAYTQTQAETFGLGDAFRTLGSAIDLEKYQVCLSPSSYLAWVGRISPEKGLEDALEAAAIAQVPLRIFGKLENPEYWQRICRQYPQAEDYYLGFLPTHELQQHLGLCRALLMTPRWVEAFGNVAIEALACGVPVIAYNRGGPAEIVQPGQTGWLVAPDDVGALAAAIQAIDQLDRQACRRQAERDYSLAAWGDRFEAWFEEILSLS